MRDVIIIPTYNEKNTISLLIPKVFKHAPQVFVIVVDDSSPDGTADEVRKMSETYPNLSVLVKEEKKGLGEAYKYALASLKDNSAVGTFITMDADGSHDPVSLPSFYEALKKHDLVVGSRYVKGAGIDNWSFDRILLSRFGNIYAKYFTQVPIHDLTAGFVGFRKRVLDKLNLDTISSSGYAYQIEFKHASHKAGFSLKEIPIIFKEREIGSSKITFSIILEGIITPLRLALKKTL